MRGAASRTASALPPSLPAIPNHTATHVLLRPPTRAIRNRDHPSSFGPSQLLPRGWFLSGRAPSGSAQVPFPPSSSPRPGESSAPGPCFSALTGRVVRAFLPADWPGTTTGSTPLEFCTTPAAQDDGASCRGESGHASLRDRGSELGLCATCRHATTDSLSVHDHMTRSPLFSSEQTEADTISSIHRTCSTCSTLLSALLQASASLPFGLRSVLWAHPARL